MGIFTFKKPLKMSSDRGLPSDRADGRPGRGNDGGLTLVAEEMFRRILSLERKRSERSRQRFVLMLVNAGSLLQTEQGGTILDAITRSLSVATRETDLGGWYEKDMVIGIICTEIGSGTLTSVLSALHSRVSAALRNDLNPQQMNMIKISFHVFPDDLELQNAVRAADSKLYPDLSPKDNATKALWTIKRAIDIQGAWPHWPSFPQCSLRLRSPSS